MADTNEPIAKPWYLSKTVLSLVAGLVLALAPKVAALAQSWFGVPLPFTITEAQANAIALFAVTQGFALYGRISATHVVTATKAGAQALNDDAKQKLALIEEAQPTASYTLTDGPVDPALPHRLAGTDTKQGS